MTDPEEATGSAAIRPSLKVTRRMSTGMKMLVILVLALLPLGMIAIFVSRESAHVNQLRHQAEANAAVSAASIRISDSFRPVAIELMRLSDTLGRATPPGASPDPALCRALLAAVAPNLRRAGAIAMFDRRGHRICAAPGYSGLAAWYPPDASGYIAHLSGSRRLVRVYMVAGHDKPLSVAEIPAERFLEAIQPLMPHNAGFSLRQGSQIIPLHAVRADNPLESIIAVASPLAFGQLSLEMRMPASQISPIEILMILLPILTWAAGAITGWLVVDRLLLRPLAQLQHAVATFGAGSGPFQIPKMRTPAHEIRELAQSFARATQALSHHETELAEALAKQKRLTREVHHRVKNNLQVISSLISLHARSVADRAVADAYASIQRRVDAVSMVHRNHSADFGEENGIPLRVLIGEIAANLRTSMMQEGHDGQIMLELSSASVTQDVAVPVAFLVTEIVDLAMSCDAACPITILLAPDTTQADHAIVSIQSDALALEPCRIGARAERLQRILGGLARQLRSTLEHDEDAGRYSVRFAAQMDAGKF